MFVDGLAMVIFLVLGAPRPTSYKPQTVCFKSGSLINVVDDIVNVDQNGVSDARLSEFTSVLMHDASLPDVCK